MSSRRPIKDRGQKDPVAEHFRRSCETLSRAADDLNLRASINEIAGAIAAAFRGGHKLLIAGNGVADRLSRLREFWSRIQQGPFHQAVAPWPVFGGLVAIGSRLRGAFQAFSSPIHLRLPVPTHR